MFAPVMIINIAFVTTLFLSLPSGAMQFAYGDCIQDEDWPDKPCLDTPPYSDDYMKQIWQQYFDFKGKDWMEMKKAEMYQTIANGTLTEWVETRSSPNNFANYNVWYYYYLNGQAPNANGPQPTQEQLQECRELGIGVGKCSETEILRLRCLGPAPSQEGVNPCDHSNEPPIKLDAPLAILFAGAGAAAVVGIFVAIRFSKKSRRGI